jgi:hypothetical protein
MIIQRILNATLWVALVHFGSKWGNIKVGQRKANFWIAKLAETAQNLKIMPSPASQIHMFEDVTLLHPSNLYRLHTTLIRDRLP